jgi:gamma-resorcylate decarboxylase
MHGKIALEEHFNLPQFEVPRYYGDAQALREVERRLLDLGEQRLAEMDAAGIEYAILSLNSPGIQAETDPHQAVNDAKQVNDTLAETVAAHHDRYGGFATLPMQDPQAAAAELERCTAELGFHGAMLNGFTNIGDACRWLGPQSVPGGSVRCNPIRVGSIRHPRGEAGRCRPCPWRAS